MVPPPRVGLLCAGAGRGEGSGPSQCSRVHELERLGEVVADDLLGLDVRGEEVLPPAVRERVRGRRGGGLCVCQGEEWEEDRAGPGESECVRCMRGVYVSVYVCVCVRCMG